jgi:translocation and assembly module TamB
MGDFRKPLITGNLSAIRGRYNFFGKPFSLSRGVFYFDGDSLSSSRFDVSGEHRHSNMTTRIRVSGSPAAPGFQIESDPPTASDEILARLFFGKEVANLTPFQALRLAQAVNTLRGGGSSMLDFFERTHKFLGVDQLDIIQSGDNNRQTVVSAGKYIRENVYVTMEKGLAAESGKVSVEVELTPNITLESEAGADSQGKIGINRKYDY